MYLRRFNPMVYDQHDSLCGCDVDDAIFCFPCLLSGGDRGWIVTGQNDLRNLKTKIKKLADSRQHFNYTVVSGMLEQSNIVSSLKTGPALPIARHNTEVYNNRETLSKIINCIKLRGKC